MTSWLCFPCRGGNNDDSHEEVRIEPTSVADQEAGESRDDASAPGNQNSAKSIRSDSATSAVASFDSMKTNVSGRGLEVPVGSGGASSGSKDTRAGDLSVRSAMPPGARSPGEDGGTGIVGFGAETPTAEAQAGAAAATSEDDGIRREPSAHAVAYAKMTDEEIIRKEEMLIERMKDAKDDVRIWLRDSLVRWRKLPVGDDCTGEQFLDAAATIPAVYPWVFKLTYAVTYLSKDYHDHISTVRKTWPKGARTMREAVRAEVKAEGSEEKLGKKYWKTCSVRLIWICRTMRMFDVIMEVLATSDETPVECGRTALDRILTPYLSWALKKIAEYIIGVCCWKTQDQFYEQVKVPPAEFKECVGMIYPLIRKHSDSMEHMLTAEIPNVVKKKC